MSIIVTPTTYPTDLMERLMFNPDLFPEHISFRDPEKQTNAIGTGAVRMVIKLVIQKLIELEVLEIKNRFIFFKNNSSNLFHDEAQLTYFCFFIGLCVKHKIKFPYHLNPLLIEHLNHNKKFSNKNIVTICSIIDKKLCDSVLDINNKEILDGMSPYAYLRDFIDPEYNKNSINSRFVICLTAILNISVPKLLQSTSSLQLTKKISGEFQISCNDFIEQLIFLNSCENENTFNRCKKMILEYINSLSESKLAKLSEWLTENNTTDVFQIKIIDKIENYYIRLQVCFMNADFHTNLFEILDENVDPNKLTCHEIYKMNFKNMSAILDSHYYHEHERKNMNDDNGQISVSYAVLLPRRAAGTSNNIPINGIALTNLLLDVLNSLEERDEVSNENVDEPVMEEKEDDESVMEEKEDVDESAKEEKNELTNDNVIESSKEEKVESTNDNVIDSSKEEKDESTNENQIETANEGVVTYGEQYTEISMKIINDFENGKKKFMEMENNNLGKFLALICDEYIEYISLQLCWSDKLFIGLESVVMLMNEIIIDNNNISKISEFMINLQAMTTIHYETAEKLCTIPQMITKNVFKAIQLSYYDKNTITSLITQILEKKYDNLSECLKKYDNTAAVHAIGEFICVLGKYDVFE